MLNPSKDRLDYGELLMPPEGYKLGQAITTTYSLDLDALISIPIAFYYNKNLDVDVTKDIIQLLESIRKGSKSIMLFCQQGQISVPRNQHRLYSFVEDCIVQVPATRSTSFHPKVWIIRYSNDEDEVIYRLIVLSRNLTFDRSWDVSFSMDGKVGKVNKNVNKPLLNFTNYLFTHTSTDKKSEYKIFLEDLPKVEFSLINDENHKASFDKFDFFPIGIPGHSPDKFWDGEKYDALTIVSPFLSDQAIELASKHCKEKIRLFSREAELDKINPTILKGIESFHLLKDYVDGEYLFEGSTETGNIETLQSQDLHAKIYAFKKGRVAYFVLGSANLTNRAFDANRKENNVEFMIQVEGKPSQIGPELLYEELFLNKEFSKKSDTSLFKKYEIKTSVIPPNDTSEIEDQLKKIKIDILLSPVNALCSKNEDGNFTVKIQNNFSIVKWDKSISVKAYLFGQAHQIVDLKEKTINEFAFANISLIDLSSFLIIEIASLTTPINLKFTLKIDIEGLPINRKDKIFHSVVSNTDNFFKYLKFILTDNYWEAETDSARMFPNNKSFGNNPSTLNFNEPVFEQLLKTLSREPRRLKELTDIISKIREEDNHKNEDVKIIKKEFLEIWATFELVLNSYHKI